MMMTVIAVIFLDRKTSLSCHFTEGNAQGETRTRTNLSSTDNLFSSFKFGKWSRIWSRINFL